MAENGQFIIFCLKKVESSLFDRWTAFPSAVCTKSCYINSFSNCTDQILYLSNNKTGACGHCKCLCSTPETPEWKLCCFHSRHSLFFFFFNCTMALINGPGNLILLAFDIGIDLYSCWKYSECIFALIFTGFHRFMEYLDLEGAHITQWRDYRVQLLSKWPIWGLIPQSWCYKYHALISGAKFVGCWTQTAIDAYFGYIQAIWCSLGFCTK